MRIATQIHQPPGHPFHISGPVVWDKRDATGKLLLEVYIPELLETILLSEDVCIVRDTRIN